MGDAGLAVQERAQALTRVGRHAEAAELLRDALAAQPEHVGLLLQLARCHRLLGQLAEAMRLVDRALGLTRAPEHPLAEKARILLVAGHPAHAGAAVRRALELAPRSWEHHGLMAEALLALGNPTRVVAARAHADTALELAPDNPELHVLDARLHARMGRLRAAREACGRALGLDPAYEPALRQLATLDAGQDRVARAARGFTDALAAEPGSAWSAEAHRVVALAGYWRLFDVAALAALVHWSLFALAEPTPRGVRLAAAGVVLAALAGLTALAWRRQPAPVRWQLRRRFRSAPALFSLLLTLTAVAALVVSGLAPVADSPVGGGSALLLAPAGVVLAFRAWRQLRRRSAPAVRWVGYRFWTRLVAHAQRHGTAEPSAPGVGPA